MMRMPTMSSVYDGKKEETMRRRCREVEGQGSSSTSRRRKMKNDDHRDVLRCGNAMLTRRIRMTREQLAKVVEEEEEVVVVEDHDQQKEEVVEGKGEKRVEEEEEECVAVDVFGLNVPTMAGWTPWSCMEEQGEWFACDFVRGPPTVEILPFGRPSLNVVTDDVDWDDPFWNFGDMPKPKPF